MALLWAMVATSALSASTSSGRGEMEDSMTVMESCPTCCRKGENAPLRRLSGSRMPPRILRVAPVDPVQKPDRLEGGHGNCFLARRRLHEPALLEPLGTERHADPVVPDDSDQRASAAAEYKQIAAMRITLQALLHQQREALHALLHICMAQRDPHPRAGRDLRKPFSAAATRVGDATA